MAHPGPRPPGPEWDGHLLLLHGSEPERLSSLAAWICRGLSRGDKVIYAEAPRPAGESVLDMSKSALGIPDGRGADFAAAVADGRLATLPLERFYPQGDQETVVDQALAEGFPSVRLATEASAGLGTGSWSAHLDIEQTIDRLCRTRPMSALCQYTHTATKCVMLRELVEVHRYRLRNYAFSMSASPDGLVLRGEIDRANVHTFATALDIASAGSKDVVRLDLAALEFIDVAACRELLHASRGLRQAGGRVILSAPQPSVDWTLRLLGVDEFAGIDVVGSGS